MDRKVKCTEKKVERDIYGKKVKEGMWRGPCTEREVDGKWKGR